MKKKLAILLILVLAMSLVTALPLFAFANSGVAVGEIEGKNYLKQQVMLLDKDFEDLKEPSYTAGSIPGLYTTKTGTVETKSALSGAKSLKFVLGANQYASEVLCFDKMSTVRTAGTYALSFKFKSDKATLLAVAVRKGWNNAATEFLADFRYTVNYTSGAITSVTKETGGWTGANQLYKNEKVTVDNGVINVYFEFDIASDVVWGATDLPGYSFQTANPADTTVIYDDIKFCNIDSNKYFTKDWDVSFEEKKDSTVWDIQPIWANDGGYETTSPLSGTHSLVINAPIGDNTQVGGITNDVGNAHKKMLHGTGLHYIQFDYDMSGLEWFNIWTFGADYYNVTFKADGTTAIEGKIQNLKVIDMGNFYRASFYVDYTNANTDHNINIKSTAGGHIYLDNLVVAHEDYAPLATNGTYNSVGAGDVDISIDLKGKDLSSIAIKGGATLTAGTDYVVGLDKVTIKASQFANLPQQIVYVLTTTGGSAEFTVSQVDNRKEITDITSTFAFEKNYDGTMVVSTTGAEFTLVGIDAGHDVKFSGSFVYASKNAGVVEVALTNVVLSGANAGEYKVKESYAFIGKINKIQLAIGDPVVTKVKAYDGAVTANATAGALTGVVEQEVVTVTATAVYNSKNVVDANKITVSYIIDGADKDNYIAPISTEVTEGVSITKIQLSLENEVVTKTKVYDGNVTASIVKGALKGILGSEKVTIEAVATYNSKDVASANKISILYTLGGEDKGNYLVPSNREISEGIAITAKSITVTAEAKSVESGKEDPILTYKVSGLVGSDALTGALAREAGTKAGEYNITLGTLKAGSNYAITFVGAKLTVTEVAPTGCCAVVFDTNSAVGMTLIMLVCIAVVLALVLRKKKIN